MKEKLTFIIAILTIISIVFGGFFWIEGRYALSEELKKVQQRLDYKILNDQFQAISEIIWKIKDRVGENPKNQTIKEELQKLESDKESLRIKIESMEKK